MTAPIYQPLHPCGAVARATLLPPGAIVVADTEETVERIARALHRLEGGNADQWALEQDARRSGREQARSVLAALREAGK